MTDPCGQAGAYFDGELDPAAQAAFLAHLPDCAVCQRDLDDVMQLDLRRPAARVRDATADLAASSSAARRRRWRRAVLSAAPAIAAVVIILVGVRPSPRPDLALRPTRGLEARLSYGDADRHRPLDVNRDRAQVAEPVPARTLADLEERGATDGLAAAYLLAGEDHRAQAVLDALPISPRRDSDLAAVLLGRGEPAGALELADRALEKQPRLGPALWNRALALRQLALPLAAAAAFDAVAALGEPGWADEARSNAAALRAEAGGRRTAWETAIEAGKAMVASDDGPVLAAEHARRVPGIARLYFYDAVRTASSPARLAQLAPLARLLDEIDGRTDLSRTLERAGGRDFAARKPLVESYRELLRTQGATPEPVVDRAVESFLHAGADDLTLGALIVTRRTQSHVGELMLLAATSQDPWFALFAEGEAAQALHSRGEDLAAERVLEGALATWTSSGVAYRRLRLGLVLDNIYLYSYRISDLRRHATELGVQASATGDWGLEGTALIHRAEAERLAMRLHVVRALFDEIALHHPGVCEIEEYLRQVKAEVALLQLDIDAAARHLEKLGTCRPLSPAAIGDLVDVARLRPTEANRAAARRRIDEYLGSALPTELAWAKVVQGRFELGVDRAKGAALLREGIQLAEAQPALGLSKRARTVAYTTLIVDAVAAGDFARGLEIFDAAAGVSSEGCVLGVALDDNRAIAIARLSDGTVRGTYDPDRGRPITDTDAVVPRELVTALAGCAHISVLALPPLHGRADLLPPELPWSYRSAGVPNALSVPPRRLIIADPTPPPYLQLPSLAPVADVAGAEVIRGPAATPSRVEQELGSATEVEIHAHGLADFGASDTAFIALSRDVDGRFALTAADVRRLRLAGRPVVYLAACRAAEVAPLLHEAWSLPIAFVAAGARAVVASTVAIPDRDATVFFAALRRRIAAGEAPAAALAQERADWLARSPTSWVRGVIVFE